MLIALLIGAVVVSVLFRTLSAQGKLSDLQSANEEVLQNSRASLELIASELRAAAGSGAIVRASRDSITFRSTRLWGVICEISPEKLDLRVGELDGRYFAPTGGAGVVVNVGTIAAPIWTDAVQITSSTQRRGRCGPDDGDGGADEVPLLSLKISGVPTAAGTPAKAGSVAVAFDQITYRSGPSSGLPGRWIQRRTGEGPGSTNQPLAGPIRQTGVGLRFRYYDRGGALVSPVTPAARDSVLAVEVLVDATSLDDRGGIRAARRDSVTVRLRNRR